MNQSDFITIAKDVWGDTDPSVGSVVWEQHVAVLSTIVWNKALTEISRKAYDAVISLEPSA